MRRHHFLALTTAVVLGAALTAPVHAGFAGTDVFLPSVGARPGVPPAVWYTTAWVHNPNPTAANVTFHLLERKANPAPLTYTDTIPAGDTRRYDNAVKTLFNSEVFGAIRVTASAKVVVGSRIYSATGTLDESSGQFFAGVPASFAIGQGQSTELLGVWQTLPADSSDFRYNFGFVETTGAGTCTVQVQAKDHTGATLGTKSYTVREWEQMQKSFTSEFPALSTSNARLTVTVSSGTGRVIAFGSQVANASQDPSTFEMWFRDELLAENSSGSGTITGVTAGAGLTGGGTSGNVSLAVANAGIVAAMLAANSVDSSKIADGTVGTADLANAAVTKAKLAASGGTNGQVLGTDGAGLVWQAPPAGGTITGVTAGIGLSGGGTSGNVSLRVATGGIDMGMLAVGSVSSSRLYLPLNLSHSGSTALNVEVTGTSNAIRGVSSAGTAVAGRGAGSGAGIYGVTNSSSGFGVWAKHEGSGIAIKAESATGQGVRASGGTGVYGENTSNGNWGYLGGGSVGVYGRRATTNASGGLGFDGYGVFGDKGSGTHAGYFQGNVHVGGTLSKTGGTFKIDHPLDPEGRYLYHSFVESPDMMNIYNGNVVTDKDGFATVELPEWFQALNRDFRYQLTVIGRGEEWVHARVASKVADNSFSIQTSAPLTEVSWLITGIRQDAWAVANPVTVEVDKPADERGTYLHPEVWGQPEERGVDFRNRIPEH